MVNLSTWPSFKQEEANEASGILLQPRSPPRAEKCHQEKWLGNPPIFNSYQK